MTAHNRKPLASTAIAALGVTALSLGLTTSAHAHVGVEAESTEPGSYTVLTVSVPHGCGDSPTTEVAIQIPEGINSVTPTRNAFYTVKKVAGELESTTTDGHGDELAERVTQVVYTATTPLPADQRDAFELSIRIPEDASGQTLYFPTVQTCEEGTDAWVQIPENGEDPHDLPYPAPHINVSASNGAETTGGDNQTPLVIGALVTGILGFLTGGLALLHSRKKP